MVLHAMPVVIAMTMPLDVGPSLQCPGQEQHHSKRCSYNNKRTLVNRGMDSHTHKADTIYFCNKDHNVTTEGSYHHRVRQKVYFLKVTASPVDTVATTGKVDKAPEVPCYMTTTAPSDTTGPSGDIPGNH